MAESAVEEYRSSLSDLKNNSKPLINMLTILAEENKQYAEHIVKLIEDRLLKAKSLEKLPVLYLLDSIVKNIGSPYIESFATHLVATFCGTFEKVDEKTRQSLYKLRTTWNVIFTAAQMNSVDLAVREIDPAWPVIPLPSSPSTPVPSTTSIHVNPKFINSGSDVLSSGSQVVTSESDLSVTPAVSNRPLAMSDERKLLLQNELSATENRLAEKKLQELQLKQQQQQQQVIDTPVLTQSRDPRTISKIQQTAPVSVSMTTQPHPAVMAGAAHPQVNTEQMYYQQMMMSSGVMDPSLMYPQHLSMLPYNMGMPAVIPGPRHIFVKPGMFPYYQQQQQQQQQQLQTTMNNADSGISPADPRLRRVAAPAKEPGNETNNSDGKKTERKVPQDSNKPEVEESNPLINTTPTKITPLNKQKTPSPEDKVKNKKIMKKSKKKETASPKSSSKMSSETHSKSSKMSSETSTKSSKLSPETHSKSSKLSPETHSKFSKVSSETHSKSSKVSPETHSKSSKVSPETSKDPKPSQNNDRDQKSSKIRDSHKSVKTKEKEITKKPTPSPKKGITITIPAPVKEKLAVKLSETPIKKSSPGKKPKKKVSGLLTFIRTLTGDDDSEEFIDSPVSSGISPDDSEGEKVPSGTLAAPLGDHSSGSSDPDNITEKMKRPANKPQRYYRRRSHSPTTLDDGEQEPVRKVTKTDPGDCKRGSRLPPLNQDRTWGGGSDSDVISDDGMPPTITMDDEAISDISSESDLEMDSLGQDDSVTTKVKVKGDEKVPSQSEGSTRKRGRHSSTELSAENRKHSHRDRSRRVPFRGREEPPRKQPYRIPRRTDPSVVPPSARGVREAPMRRFYPPAHTPTTPVGQVRPSLWLPYRPKDTHFPGLLSPTSPTNLPKELSVQHHNRILLRAQQMLDKDEISTENYRMIEQQLHSIYNLSYQRSPEGLPGQPSLLSPQDTNVSTPAHTLVTGRNELNTGSGVDDSDKPQDVDMRILGRGSSSSDTGPGGLGDVDMRVWGFKLPPKQSPFGDFPAEDVDMRIHPPTPQDDAETTVPSEEQSAPVADQPAGTGADEDTGEDSVILLNIDSSVDKIQALINTGYEDGRNETVDRSDPHPHSDSNTDSVDNIISIDHDQQLVSSPDPVLPVSIATALLPTPDTSLMLTPSDSCLNDSDSLNSVISSIPPLMSIKIQVPSKKRESPQPPRNVPESPPVVEPPVPPVRMPAPPFPGQYEPRAPMAPQMQPGGHGGMHPSQQRMGGPMCMDRPRNMPQMGMMGPHMGMRGPRMEGPFHPRINPRFMMGPQRHGGAMMNPAMIRGPLPDHMMGAMAPMMRGGGHEFNMMGPGVQMQPGAMGMGGPVMRPGMLHGGPMMMPEGQMGANMMMMGLPQQPTHPILQQPGGMGQPEEGGVTLPLSVNINDLFAKLVSVGIINESSSQLDEPESTPTSAADLTADPVTPVVKDTVTEDSTTTTPGESGPADEPTTEPKKEPPPPPEPVETARLFSIPRIDIEDSDELKQRIRAVSDYLYSGIQCSSCGLRFPNTNMQKYADHLDWHFRQNKRLKDKRALSRKWYYTLEEWQLYVEYMEIDDRMRSKLFESQSLYDGLPLNNSETISSCRINPDTPDDEVCKICGEPFEQFWDEKNEEWHLRDCDRVNEQTYHPLCYQDVSVSRRGQSVSSEFFIPGFSHIFENNIPPPDDNETKQGANELVDTIESKTIEPHTQDGATIKTEPPESLTEFKIKIEPHQIKMEVEEDDPVLRTIKQEPRDEVEMGEAVPSSETGCHSVPSSEYLLTENHSLTHISHVPSTLQTTDQSVEDSGVTLTPTQGEDDPQHTSATELNNVDTVTPSVRSAPAPTPGHPDHVQLTTAASVDVMGIQCVSSNDVMNISSDVTNIKLECDTISQRLLEAVTMTTLPSSPLPPADVGERVTLVPSETDQPSPSVCTGDIDAPSTSPLFSEGLGDSGSGITVTDTCVLTYSEFPSSVGRVDSSAISDDSQTSVPDIPPTVSDIPSLISDIPPTVSDIPFLVSDIPPTVTDIPTSVSDILSSVSDIPLLVSDVPSPVTDIPSTVSDILSSVSDIPFLVSDIPPSVSDIPSTVSDVPSSVSDVPPSFTDIPPAATNIPPTITDIPPAATDIPPAVTDIPPAVSDISDGVAYSPQQLDIPADNTPPTVYIPSTLTLQPQSDPSPPVSAPLDRAATPTLDEPSDVTGVVVPTPISVFMGGQPAPPEPVMYIQPIETLSSSYVRPTASVGYYRDDNNDSYMEDLTQQGEGFDGPEGEQQPIQTISVLRSDRVPGQWGRGRHSDWYHNNYGSGGGGRGYWGAW